MADKPLAGAGLRGQSAGATALCTVGKTGSGLTYRGFDIKELAEKAKFEEVAYLLLKGKLPNQAELDHYIAKLKGLRGLPDALKTVLEQIPKDAHPMDVMRTGASMLGNLETEESFDEQQDVADRLLAVLPSIICYWYRFSHDGVRIDTETDDASVGGHFLHMLRGEPASELHARVMNVSLILYAEHEFNASTFTARVCASTLSDMHSCITGAIGSLRGPLHGGANEAVLRMLATIGTVDKVPNFVKQVKNGEGRLMGFGHRVYKAVDPRSIHLQEDAKALGERKGEPKWFSILQEVIEVMQPYAKKGICQNVDFFSGAIYYLMGIPDDLFISIFAMGRIPGWTQHVMEQYENNILLRPRLLYTGPMDLEYIPIDERS